MRHDPVGLTPTMRDVVGAAIAAYAESRGWALLAVNVRTNHVHCVLTVPGGHADRILAEVKAAATRRLRSDGLVGQQQAVWSFHGSTRYLWSETAVVAAVDYVLHRQ